MRPRPAPPARRARKRGTARAHPAPPRASFAACASSALTAASWHPTIALPPPPPPHATPPCTTPSPSRASPPPRPQHPVGRSAARLLQEVSHLLPAVQRLAAQAGAAAGLGHRRRRRPLRVRRGAVRSGHARAAVPQDDQRHLDAGAGGRRAQVREAIASLRRSRPDLRRRPSEAVRTPAPDRHRLALPPWGRWALAPAAPGTCWPCTTTATRPRASRWRCGTTTRASCSAGSRSSVRRSQPLTPSHCDR